MTVATDGDQDPGVGPSSIAQSAGLPAEMPFVGRAHQVTKVSAALASVTRGQGGVMLIFGEAGIGKTRLLKEVRKSLPETIVWLEGHALSFSQRVSYWPFVQLLRPLLGIPENVNRDDNWDVFERRVFEVAGPEATEIIPYLATLLGLDVPDSYAEKVRYVDGDVLGSQILRAMWRFFDALAKKQPVVLVIEDLHWADQSSIVLLEHLLALAQTAPIFFCILSRTENEVLENFQAAATRLLPDRVYTVQLSPLAVRDSQLLITSLIGDDAPTRRIRDLILYKAGGNPFFIAEVVHALVESHVLVKDEATGAWSVRTQDVTIPDTVQAVIRSRIDRLDGRLQEVLGTAAVIGRMFFYRVLRAVTAPDAEIDDRLAKLTSIEILEVMKSSAELEYMFRHALAQEVSYERLEPDQRRQLHDRVAACIELLYAGRLGEVASLLAFHYARAGIWDKALRYLIDAGDQATRLAADDEALLHYDEAVKAYSEARGSVWNATERAIVECRLGEIYFRRSAHDIAYQHLKRAIELLGDKLPTGKFGIHLATLGQLAKHLLRMVLSPPARALKPSANPTDEAHIRTYQALAFVCLLSRPEELTLVSMQLANCAGRARAANSIAVSYAMIGFALDQLGWRFAAKPHLARAIKLADRFNNTWSIAFSYNTIGLHHLNGGRVLEAQRCLLRAADAAEQAGDLNLACAANIVLSHLWREVGDFQSMIATADKMLTLGRESAFRSATRAGHLIRGMALRRLGRPIEAETCIRQALDLGIANDDELIVTAAAGELIFCLLNQDRIADAEHVLIEAKKHPQSDHTLAHIRINLQLAETELRIRELEQNPTSGAQLVAAKASKITFQTARLYRMGLPSALRLRANLDWFRGRKKAAVRDWRQAISAAGATGAKWELGLTSLEMNVRVGQTAEAERWRERLALLGQK